MEQGMHPDRPIVDQNIFSWIFQNNTCTFMKRMHLFIVLLPRPGLTVAHALAISRCKARSRMPMVPPGISGCQTGSAFIGLAAWKMESTPCLFCRMARPYGQVFWADPFRMDVLCLVRTIRRSCMIGQR